MTIEEFRRTPQTGSDPDHLVRERTIETHRLKLALAATVHNYHELLVATPAAEAAGIGR